MFEEITMALSPSEIDLEMRVSECKAAAERLATEEALLSVKLNMTQSALSEERRKRETFVRCLQYLREAS